MRYRVHQEIFFISCLLLAFFLPVLPKLLPGIISLMSVNWLFSGIYLKTVPKLFREKWRLFILSFASIYLLYLVGMLYSADLEYGWFDLQVKLSLFIFPLIFATSDLRIFSFPRIRYVLGSFIAGCLTGSMILFGHAWFVNARSGIRDPFYYTNLAWYFHSSYLAMYYTFAIGILLYYLAFDFTRQRILKTIILFLVIFSLEAMIFLLSSKAGLIILATTELLFILFLLSRKVRFVRIAGVSLILIVAYFGFSRIFPYAFSRMAKAESSLTSPGTMQKNTIDGTFARVEILKVSLDLIRQHFIFGVGTGDVKNVYLHAYQQKNLYPVLKKRLNAHNQYFQTFVALGIIGLCILVFSLAVPLYRSLRNRQYLYALFIVIFTFNILFESMLETQAGVIFYAFFNAFLFQGETAKKFYSEI